MRSILGISDTLKSERISPSHSGRNGEDKNNYKKMVNYILFVVYDIY